MRFAFPLHGFANGVFKADKLCRCFVEYERAGVCRIVSRKVTTLGYFPVKGFSKIVGSYGLIISYHHLAVNMYLVNYLIKL